MELGILLLFMHTELESLPKVKGLNSLFCLGLVFKVWQSVCFGGSRDIGHSVAILLCFLGTGYLLQPRLSLGGGQHTPWHFPRVPHQSLWRPALCPHPHVTAGGEPHEPLPEECRPGGDRAGADIQARRALQPCSRPFKQPVWLTPPW